MPKFEVEVKVMPRAGLLDPQGAAVEHALSALDFADIAEVRVGRAISIRLERRDRETAPRSEHYRPHAEEQVG